MRRRHIIVLTASAAFIAASSGNMFDVDGPILKPLIALVQGGAAKAAVPQAPSQADGGPLGTMPHGTYQCALPGDADGSVIKVVESENFRIARASRYRNEEGGGLYLMRGKMLTFTQGPKKGERFMRLGDNQLQQVKPDGSLSKLICTRLGGTS